VKVAPDAVERELAVLWQQESERSEAPRIEVMTLVALVSEPSLLDRTQAVVAEVVHAHPSRTIVATAVRGEKADLAVDVALHRDSRSGRVFGDALVLEATGSGRDWLPENISRFVLAHLPVCLWWVGNVPDFDRLFDRLLRSADSVVVDSSDMRLCDLQRLSEIVAASQDRYALSDLTWIRLRPLQKLVARFFDDDHGRSCLTGLHRVQIEFASRGGDIEPASPEAALLFGWVAHALGLPLEGVAWKRAGTYSEATVGKLTVRFERKERADVPPGALLAITLEGDCSRFELQRQEDPRVFRWSREVPGAPMPAETLRCPIHDQAALLVRTFERPRRDPLFESSLHAASRIVRDVAPRLSRLPAAHA
jgi:glucose-6-phosphate dehydrogenase assembly protein OpcA